jgi:hypothetical protein
MDLDLNTLSGQRIVGVIVAIMVVGMEGPEAVEATLVTLALQVAGVAVTLWMFNMVLMV